MKQEAKYVNHRGEEVNLNGDGIYLNNGELPAWSVNTVALNEITMAITRPRRSIPLEIKFLDDNAEHGLEKRSQFYRVVARDIEALKPGRLYVGGWYLEGYLVSSVPKNYWYTGELAEYECAFLADDPRWTREKVQTFVSVDTSGTDGLDYPHDYPHDYGASWFSDKVRNATPVPAPIRMTIPGPTTHGWNVRIGNNVYECDIDLLEGERLVIDGEEETITHYNNLGAAINAFHTRKGTYKEGSGTFIFEPVPSGDSTILWIGCDGVEIVVFEKMDEWAWTELGW